MDTPKNFITTAKNQACYSTWDSVTGADGYVLRFYRANKPALAFKTRYAQGNSRTTHGFENGKRYLVDICAFVYEGEKEIRGPFSEKVSFVPYSNQLSAQEVVALRSGEDFQLKWDYQNTTPIVNFVSEDTSVAVVDENGFIKAVGRGTTKINISMVDPYGNSYAEKEYNFSTTVYVDRDFRRQIVQNRKATICLVGDLMCGAESLLAYKNRRYDFSPAFYHVKSVLSKADYSVGVLETMCDDSQPYESDVLRTANGRPNSNSPSTFIGALKDAGFSGLVTAHNHNCDAGLKGLQTTINTILNYGMDNIGTMSLNPIIAEINGINVAFIALSLLSNGLDGITKNAENDLGRFSEGYAKTLIDDARNQNAEFVIVIMHWGKMNSPLVDDSQVGVAKFLANAGADLIIGSESHVVQKMENIVAEDGREVPCVYSMGNFFSSIRDVAENIYSYIAKLELCKLDSGEISSKISFIPCYSRKENGLFITDIAKPSFSREADATISYINRVYGVDKVCFVGNDTDGTKILAQGSVVERILNYGRISADIADVDDTAQRGFEYFVLDLMSESLNIPADESKWQPLMDIFIKKIRDNFGNGKIILIRISDVNDYKGVLGKMENYLIDKAQPIVVDVARYYSYRVNDDGRYEFEPLFLEHCSKIISTIIASKNINQFYFSEINEEIWMKRVLAMYKDLDNENVRNTLINREYAADMIVDETSFEFVACYQNVLLEIKKARVDIDHVRALINRPEMEEVTEAVNIILQIRDNPRTIMDMSFYRVAQKYNFRCTRGILAQGRRKSDSVGIYSNDDRRYRDSRTHDMVRENEKPISEPEKKAIKNDYLSIRTVDTVSTTTANVASTAATTSNTTSAAATSNTTSATATSNTTSAAETTTVAASAMSIETPDKAANMATPSAATPSEATPSAATSTAATSTVTTSTAAMDTIAATAANADTVKADAVKFDVITDDDFLTETVTVDIWGSNISKSIADSLCAIINVNENVVMQPCVFFEDDKVECKLPNSSSSYGSNEKKMEIIKSAFLRDGKKRIAESTSKWIVVDLCEIAASMAKYKSSVFATDEYLKNTELYKGIERKCSDCCIKDEVGLYDSTKNVRRFVRFIAEKYDDNVILVKSNLSFYNNVDGYGIKFDDDRVLRDQVAFIKELESVFEFESSCYVIDTALSENAEEFKNMAAQSMKEILGGSRKHYYGRTR